MAKYLLASFVLVAMLIPVVTNAEPQFNEDGYCDPVGNNHDDNKESTKEFKEKQDSHICELADCIDEESCTGATDLDDFKETEAGKSSNPLIDECLEERDDLPGSGPDLAAYEIQKCAQGDEDYY